MAATEYGRGLNISAQPAPEGMVKFILAKEFGFAPDIVERQSSKNIKGLMTILSIYNKVQNQQMAPGNKPSKGGGKTMILRNEEIDQFNEKMKGKKV